jgi:GTP cyclohydrolase II
LSNYITFPNNKRDIALLEQIHKYFGVGKVSIGSNAVISFDSIKELEVVINHFDKYPLITKKFEDYKLFKQAFDIVKNHLTEEGLRQLVAIKTSLNKGLSD